MATKRPSPKEAISARREQLRAEHAESVREKIQTTTLVNVLQDFALGKSKAKMTPARLKAIEMLLDKSVPDLAAIKHEIQTDKVQFFINTDAPAKPDAPAE
jgi:hypothetical protein